MTDRTFVQRHVGPSGAEIAHMLQAVGVSSLDELADRVVPSGIRLSRELDLPAPLSEEEALARLTEMASENRRWRCFLGTGYHRAITPPVIQRNILENPGWYTAYTPYQAEIAQGRLEALLVFQTLVQDLTGFEVSNASLLDEATAAAEAVTVCRRIARRNKAQHFFVDASCHPQTLAVLRTRARWAGIPLIEGDPLAFDFGTPVFGCLVSYPGTDGTFRDLRAFCDRAHAGGATVAAACDPMSLALVEPPAAWGADLAIGSTQRFGLPLGYGGPHAAFLATSKAHARMMPGRIIGITRDRDGRRAYRMSLQTREQHIRRARATSNICTAQVLPAVVAAMYAVYHGPEGLRAIAARMHRLASTLAESLRDAGFEVGNGVLFDTVSVGAGARTAEIVAAAEAREMLLRRLDDGRLCIAFDETTTDADLDDLLAVFGARRRDVGEDLPSGFARQSTFLQAEVFSAYRSETEMLRYLHRLQARDLSLTHAMIPLGSCTMKLNATTEMMGMTLPGFADVHPFVPSEHARGYRRLHDELEGWLAEITGFHAVSLQPNAGSQGEYAGLLVIRAYHESRGDSHRDVCLIPTSAHGTNPASAVMAGLRVVEVACDDQGNVDVADLSAKAEVHKDALCALMVTYPSTHGVFEEAIADICEIVHGAGGQVYMDGANLNAMVGLCRPGDIGADVCHLNLHKTFCIPHGGGGPGMGPIGVASHLAPFLPGHPCVDLGTDDAIGAISAAPWGSPSILPISWAYIAMMGAVGLRHATEVAILSANYIAKRLEGDFDVLFRGASGFVAHECILDCRSFKTSAGIEVEDLAKRLMDYGFHAPTMSWPVAGTLMVEPTESEAQIEIDRFCDAMRSIRAEIRAVESGIADAECNVLRMAPHTAAVVCADAWDRPYGREAAAFPNDFARAHKFWPSVSRVDQVYGDKNLLTSLHETA